MAPVLTGDYRRRAAASSVNSPIPHDRTRRGQGPGPVRNTGDFPAQAFSHRRRRRRVADHARGPRDVLDRVHRPARQSDAEPGAQPGPRRPGRHPGERPDVRGRHALLRRRRHPLEQPHRHGRGRLGQPDLHHPHNSKTLESSTMSDREQFAPDGEVQFRCNIRITQSQIVTALRPLLWPALLGGAWTVTRIADRSTALDQPPPAIGRDVDSADSHVRDDADPPPRALPARRRQSPRAGAPARDVR
jgi:hypothetical protein